MPLNIVLTHGYLGYGSEDVRYVLTPYFKGVARRLRELGHDVFEPGVTGNGSVEARSRELADQLRVRFPGNTTMHVIGHSMGGLDARRVLVRDADLRRRISSLVCIGTPHLGSPVASELLHPSALFGTGIPGALIAAARVDRGALPDLALRETPLDDDVDGVRYVDIACDGRSDKAGSPLFWLTRKLGGIDKSVINDGVVLRDSACIHPSRHEHWPMWPVDHGGAIGWASDWPTISVFIGRLPPGHLERYENIVARLASGS
ncbi:MAG: hypothetical protein JO006_04490 [Paucibacter sp.]|nr:hypothetical protein [Roseateles sp.]